MKSILILTATLCILSSTLAAGDSESTAGAGEGQSSEVEWQIITNQNFYSQIRLHPHLLLLITVPWSGEARSVMKELAQAVSMKHEKSGSLQLRVMYKSSERVLADTLGASEGLNFLYYHHSLSYRYQGRIHAHNVLSSIYSVMSLLPEELPLKPLDTPEVIKSFVESTDKSVILMEFCGWTSRLLAEKKHSLTENVFSTEGSASDTNLDGEITKPLMYMESKDHKDSQKRLSCAVNDKKTEFPFVGELYSVNKSATMETESTMPGFGSSCTFEEFQLFESFFTKFISVTREFFLPPERQRYGLVTDKSLLSFLDVEDPSPWLGMIKVAGCSGCVNFFKEVDELKLGLQTHNAFIPELEDDGHDTEPALPENKPSILLFVDRSSESSVTRKKSVEALVYFRHLASKYQSPYQVDWKKNDPRTRAQAAARNTNLHSKLEQSPISSIANLKEKIKIVIVKDGKQVTLDNVASNFQGNSFNDIMAYFRQNKKESTLSSLAKELGFQLLSGDHDIKVEDTIPSEPFQSNQLPSSLPLEGITKNHDGLSTGHYYTKTISTVGHGVVTKIVDGDPSSHYNEKPTHVGAESQTTADRHDISPVIDELTNEDKNHSIVEKRQEELDAEGFNGSFFFSDGGYQLLRALTGSVNIPSMVIFDPLSMQHFVYPDDGAFTNSSLFDFLHQYMNRTLIPYQRSESILSSSKEDFCTPFVNHGSSEVDSVPPVTAISLNKYILSLIQSRNHSSAHGCKEDVLVLFSNRWCGFCLRMELIVREVYRALKGYKTQKVEKNASLQFGSDSLMDDTMQFPLIYMMDCTLNECSYILKSMGQSEVYPALTLFPAEKKHAVSYEGDMTVTDVIKFIANHGSQSHHLITENGILFSEVEHGGKKQNLLKDIHTNTVSSEDPIAIDNSCEVLLKNWLPKRPTQYNQVRPQTSNDKGHIIAGSVLIATEKLINVPTFQNSMILIIQADRSTGFLGVIINKLISWDSLHNLEHNMSLDLEQLQEAPLSFGGPVLTREMPLIALSRKFIKQEYPEILPGVSFLDQTATREEIEGLGPGNVSLTDYWFFLGYSSWGWDQLYDEIDDGAWNLTDKDLVQLDWPH